MQGSFPRFRVVSLRAASAAPKVMRTSPSPLCKHLVVLAAFFLAAMLLYAPPAIAQPTFRDLSGTVSDRHHEPLRGAVVQVHNESTQGILSYITGTDGAYSFKRLDGATDYHVWATYRSHRSRIRKLSLFDSKPTKKINLVVRLQ